MIGTLEYGKQIRTSEVWDKDEKQEWVKIEVDKWIYETVDLKRFQDKKLHNEIWDISTLL